MASIYPIKQVCDLGRPSCCLDGETNKFFAKSNKKHYPSNYEAWCRNLVILQTLLPRLVIALSKFIEHTRQTTVSLDFLVIFHQGKRTTIKRPIKIIIYE